MKTFFSKAWQWIAVFFGGIIVGLTVFRKKPERGITITNITAETYVAEQNQQTKIGKIKQRGDGNQQDVDQSPVATESRKAKRQANRARKREQRSKPATDEEV